MSETTPAPVANHFKDAQEELREAKRVLDRTVKLLDAAAAGRFLEASSILNRAPDLFNKLRSTAARTAEVNGLSALLQSAISEARSRYQKTLEEALTASSCEWSGAWPDYLVHDVVPLTVDFRADRVRVGGKTTSSLEVPVVVAAVRRQISSSLGRPFDSASFLERLVRAYDDALQGSGARGPTYIRVREVFRSYSATKPTPAAWRQFGIDIYRLMNSDALQRRGVSLEFSPARNPSNALLIPAKGGGNYISALRVDQAAPS
jgi:hypothetical protein